MIIVTGGAGFIGSNLVKGLNKIGRRDILVVDDMTDGTKFRNIVDCEIFDYLDREKFINKIINEKALGEKIEVIFHLGACSDTTEWDGNYLLSNNYEYSKILFHYCLAEHIPFIYASSAAVYGISKNFTEDPANELPINAYGYSKLLFDQHVRRFLPNPKSQVVGLRYFNVYGPREQHKGKMASVMLHLNKQIQQTDQLKLFVGTDGYADGEQLRDFIYVEDVVNVNLWFWKAANKSGIYNVGTGKAATYNSVARAIIDFYKKGEITYIPFPEGLRNSYQSFTQADITKLRQIGYSADFKDINAGINNYLHWLQQ